MAKSVVDLGCGCGDYLKIFSSVGLRCHGVDLNPFAPEVSDGLCRFGDLTKPLEFEGPDIDWALSLEVAEHIPEFLEMEYLNNIVRHSARGVVMSWASRQQPGVGHVNGRASQEVDAIFARLGYRYDKGASEALRAHAGVETTFGSCCGHLRLNLLVLRRLGPGVMNVLPAQWFQRFLAHVSDRYCEGVSGVYMDGKVRIGSCHRCRYRLHLATHRGARDVLLALNADVPLHWAERMCCLKGEAECQGFEVDPLTGQRRLLKSLGVPGRWSGLVSADDLHFEAGIYSKELQDNQLLKRGGRRPGEEDDGMWRVTSVAELDVEELRSIYLTCLNAFEAKAFVAQSSASIFAHDDWMDQAGACIGREAEYMIFETGLDDMLEQDATSLVNEEYDFWTRMADARASDATAWRSLGAIGVCMPPPPDCDHRDEASLGWHVLLRHVLAVPSKQAELLLAPPSFGARARIRSAEDLLVKAQEILAYAASLRGAAP